MWIQCRSSHRYTEHGGHRTSGACHYNFRQLVSDGGTFEHLGEDDPLGRPASPATLAREKRERRLCDDRGVGERKRPRRTFNGSLPDRLGPVVQPACDRSESEGVRQPTFYLAQRGFSQKTITMKQEKEFGTGDSHELFEIAHLTSEQADDARLRWSPSAELRKVGYLPFDGDHVTGGEAAQPVQRSV